MRADDAVGIQRQEVVDVLNLEVPAGPLARFEVPLAARLAHMVVAARQPDVGDVGQASSEVSVVADPSAPLPI